jgi:hypothetical protein
MYYLIYKTTNKLNDKIYVGKHKTEDKNDDYLGSGTLLERSIEKYGRESFVREILFEFSTEEEMNQKEADIVDEEFIARDDTYNIKLGGQGGFDYINKTEKNGNSVNRSKEHLVKMGKSAAKKLWNRWNDDPKFREEYSKKLSNRSLLRQLVYGNAFEGKTHTEEAKRSIGEKNKVHQKGSGNSQYGKHWITDGKESKSVKKDLPIPEGWRKGRV